jgi:hypothetical protein
VRRVWTALAEPHTDAELEELTGLAGNSLRPARVRLLELGAITDTGERRPTSSGRPAIVWARAEIA